MWLLGSSCEDYVTLRFLSTNLFLWGHELANSLRLFKLQRSFLQIIINFSWRQRLHFLLIISATNSLIIHKEKTKEITTMTVVWIPDLN